MVTAQRVADAGIALILVLLTIATLSGVGLGLALSASLIRLTAANQDDSLALANAAESALELAARDLAAVTDWNDVLSGARVSSLVDGPPGLRTLGPNDSLDLATLTNLLNCGAASLCSAAQIAQATLDRPWGANNPSWRLFLHAPLTPPALPAAARPSYVVVWIGDDARETDGDPALDGAGADEQGRYIVRARAESFGARGGRYVIEADLARFCTDDGVGVTCTPGIRVQSWRAVSSVLP